MTDTAITVTMPQSAWATVAASNPAGQENYTPEGLAMFNAWQPLLQAAAGDQPDAALTAANTDEVTGLKATALPGAVKLTWDVSSTAYLQSFLVVVSQNGVAKNRVVVLSTAREATVTCEGTGYLFNVEAIVAQGGKTVRCDPLPPPVEPPLTGSNLCLPGVCFNGGSTAAKVREIGAQVIRIESGVTSLAGTAQPSALRCCPIVSVGSVSGPLGEYEALDAAHKAAVIGLEFGNENWPGGIGSQMSGKAYGEAFVKAAAEARGVVPLLCQVNLTPTNTSWTVELLGVPGIAQALEGNYTAHHSYGDGFMRPCVEPGNLLGQGHGWECQRCMKEQAYVLERTGVKPPMCITEYGDSIARVGQQVQAERVTELFRFAELVKNGTVPAAWLPAAGYVPEMVFFAYYSMMGNHPGGSNTFGLEFYAGSGQPEGHNEPAWANFHAGAALLAG